MMIDKTKLGVEFFDETFGGVYRGRTVLCYGRRESGKTVAAARFLHQAFRDGDRGLLLTDWQANDSLIVAEAVGAPFSHMVREGNLTILEYSSIVPGCDMGGASPLPPSAFVELQKIIVSRSIRRVVFDTVVPWLAIHPISKMPGHVYSFIHALERLNVTVLITLPWPASTPAFMLKNRLEDLCPVVFTIQKDASTGDSFFKVSKYLGDSLSGATPTAFRVGGVQKAVPMEASDIPAPAVRAPAAAAAAPAPASTPSPPTPSPPPVQEDRGPINFSSVVDF
ncbi:MAG: ATPase domain-containing protein [Kiritimatiellae bacterium]|nr:ATPase domain-containing protein [Kiritimatiellia bacterium]